MAFLTLLWVLSTAAALVLSQRSNLAGVDKKELIKEILHRCFLSEGYLPPVKDVRFLAYPSNHFTLTPNGPMKFDNVQGLGYDGKSGIFQSPRGGVYLFHWTVLSHHGKPFDLNLYHNSIMIMRSWTDATTKHATLSGTMVLRLDTGDKVCLQTTYSGGVIHNGRWSVFGGELLRY